MTTLFLFVGAFVLSLWAANRSLRHGLLAVLAIGYFYGILRANIPDTWTYLTFDAAVLGLYVGQIFRRRTGEQPQQNHDLRLWLVLLIAWPTLLFFAFPSDAVMVELVGLRANIFLLPFLLLGTRLSNEDLEWLAVRVALLNLAVVGVGIVEFFVGIEPFFPKNETTDLIYKTRDLVGRTAHRIPATFANAHAFAGTMVITLPLLIGAWTLSSNERRWHGRFLAAAIVASLLGVFMAAARIHMLTAAALVGVVTFMGGLRRQQWLRWAVAIGVVAYVVAGEERLQRFTTLQDTTFLAERWSGSVNENFFELIRTYPLGFGLAGGGTSVPYFLRANQAPMVMENEYARIGLEQGLPGLALWLVFLALIFSRWPTGRGDPWVLGQRLAWVACASFFFSGLTGTGLMSSVPQTVLMLLMMGWFAHAKNVRRAVPGVVVSRAGSASAFAAFRARPLEPPTK